MLFVVLLCNCRQPLLSPEVPIAGSPVEVHIKAVERNSAANVALATFDAFLNKTASSAGELWYNIC
jgi:hypothetical protein